jgi:hypothetical protein
VPVVEAHPGAAGIEVDLDPLEGVGPLAARIGGPGGQLQAAGLRGLDVDRPLLVQVAAQDQAAAVLDDALGLAGVEFGQVGPGMVDQGDGQIGGLGLGGAHCVAELVQAHQQPAVVLVAGGQPGGVETGDVDPAAREVEDLRPPGQLQGLAAVGVGEAQPVAVALEQRLTFLRALEHVADLVLAGLLEQVGLGELG